MRAVAFVPVRLTSSRLPEKHLCQIGDRRLVDWVMGRLQAAKELDQVVICCPDEPGVEKLQDFELFIYPGDPHDVVGRLTAAAQAYAADICVLASGDCPLLDAAEVDRLVVALRQGGDLALSNDEGLQAMQRSVWERAERSSDRFELREHQFPVVKIFVDLQVIEAGSSRLKHRLSVDRKADLEFMEMVYQGCMRHGWPFDLKHAIQLLQLEPDLMKINAHVYQKQLLDKTPRSSALLISSLGAKVPLVRAVRSALERHNPSIRLWGADKKSDCAGRSLVDGFSAMPEWTPDALLRYCNDLGIRWIVPTRDGELAFFAAQKERLGQNDIAVMVASEEAIKKCTDKLAFHEALQGFPVIPTSLQPLDTARLVVKERFGSGSRGVGVNLLPAAAQAHAAQLAEPLFQPFIAGRELSADLYIDRWHRPQGIVLRWRDQVVDGESKVTTSFRQPAWEGLILEAAQTLGITGHALFQAIVDPYNQLHLIEANCRFGGASALAIAAGLDSFYWFLLESAEREWPLPQISSHPKRLIRTATEDLIRDA